MIRLPTLEEKRLYQQAANDRPPFCILVKLTIPGWIRGITIGPFIFHEINLLDVIVHEMVHVRQFYRQPLTFWIRYLWQRVTTDMNPYEQEAYAVQAKAREITSEARP